MGVFDRSDYDAKKVMNDVLSIQAYSWERSGNFDTGFFSDSAVNNGWQVLDAKSLGYNGWYNDYNAFYGEQFGYLSAQCTVLGKYDATGKLISMGISFWGTGDDKDSKTKLINTIGDGISDLLAALSDNFADDYTLNAFDRLLGCVVETAKANGLSGEDIIISGHSLGGLAVNSMATQSSLGQWGGFFEESKYVAMASPTQNTTDDKVLNIGYENDPVFRVLNGTDFSLSSLGSHDAPLETCTNNIVTFNDFYAGKGFMIPGVSIINPFAWASHNGAGYYDGIKTILNSEVYDFTHINSTIIVSELSDKYRGSVWVEDLNKAIKHSGSTFILGSDGNDLLRGGKGNDYLVGGKGNDNFQDKGGFNVIYGGDGENIYSTCKSTMEFDAARDGNGNLFFKFSNGDITKTEQVEYVTSIEPTHNWWFWQPKTKEVSYHATEKGLETDTMIIKYADSYYADQGNQYEVYAENNHQSSWLFSGEEGSKLHMSNNGDNVVSGSGDDVIYAGAGADTFLYYNEFGNDIIYDFGINDKFIFMSNSSIADNDSYLNHLSIVDNDAVLTFGDSSVTLVGITADSLSAGQFILA